MFYQQKAENLDLKNQELEKDVIYAKQNLADTLNVILASGGQKLIDFVEGKLTFRES
ncbi:hypothetical protein IMG5_047450 [Ichthyophthirius multifiliis]|uniref:Uncharacterized protein n=1 Tax=Ichthyophthirius multifiliis TaxID=5932 RepID=G0QMB4_ICHMU|nr:hypothetical protein IMG5_047450 [Ichthyophthirius multifiliis]EGR33636.1 hypothetical protein IMG5_047450 [Ichthyophthirius multifiliis]|eukprot:XP_004037622.1 hypothetical protein IMG5_047450 [Ichthyophthirius multifiliis]